MYLRVLMFPDQPILVEGLQAILLPRRVKPMLRVDGNTIAVR